MLKLRNEIEKKLETAIIFHSPNYFEDLKTGNFYFLIGHNYSPNCKIENLAFSLKNQTGESLDLSEGREAILERKQILSYTY